MSFQYSRMPWPRGSVREGLGLDFFILNKNGHEEHKGHDFHVTKSVKPPLQRVFRGFSYENIRGVRKHTTMLLFK